MLNVHAESVNRTAHKGWPEALLAAVAAVLAIIGENVDALPLDAEAAIVLGLVLQLVLQALRRLGRDARAGAPPAPLAAAPSTRRRGGG